MTAASAPAPDPSRRAAWLLAGSMVAALLAVAVLLFGRTAERGAFAEAFSTFRATPDGAKAAFILLERLGHRVHRHAEETLALEGADVLFVLEPAKAFTADEAEALERFVEAGGCLVYAARDESEVHRRFGVDLKAQAKNPPAPVEVVPAIPSAYARGVASLAPDPHPRTLESSRASAVPIFRGPNGVEAFAVRAGQGKALLFADPSPFANRALERAGNAALLAAIAAAHARPGGRGARIAFDEYHHGFEAERGVAGYLGRRALAPALVQALVAFSVPALALGGRRGRPPVLEEDRPPESREHIRAMAEIYAKARLGHHCAERLWKAIIRDLEVATGVAAAGAGPAGREAVAEVLRRRGVKSFRGLEKIGKRHARIDAFARRGVAELELLLYAREVARFEADCRAALGPKFGDV